MSSAADSEQITAIRVFSSFYRAVVERALSGTGGTAAMQTIRESLQNFTPAADAATMPARTPGDR